ncbi:MAG: HAD-IIIA family hydrolase [Candidatus Thermoplasmatota archaeon]
MSKAAKAPFTVFLDRDGVLCKAPRIFLRRASRWVWLPGAKEAVARLNRDGIRICLATNQPFVGVGLLSRRHLERLHAWMLEEIRAAGGRIDRVEYADRAFGRRHKPRPGMLEDGGSALGTDPARSVMVGDNLKDADAGRRYGARTLLLATTHRRASLEDGVRKNGWDTPIVGSLLEASDLILAMAGFQPKSP